MYKKESKINLNVGIIAAIFLVLVVPVVGNQPATTAQAQTTAPMQSISLVKSGLVVSDSLTTGDTSYWTPFSSTINTPLLRDYYEDSQGLHIGVQSPYSGKWVNYGLVSPDTTASLFHAVVTNNYTSVYDGNVGTTASVFEAGLYVMSSNSNYVGCIAVADFSGHYWAVHQARGSQIIGSGIMTTLYQSPLNTMPLTQDCTIITNGNNSLKVYLSGNLVVSRNDMDLQMPTPFKALLQVDSSSPTMRYGTFFNYYATSSEEVTVTNAPLGGTVQIVDSSNNTLTSAPVASDGTATMLMGMYSLPLVANIEVYNSTNALIANTPSTVNIFGGDVYSAISSVPQPISTSTLTVNTQKLDGDAIEELWIQLYQNGEVIDSGSSPVTFTLNDNQLYTVVATDWVGYSFDHWLDTGSTNSARDISLSTDTTITAVYRTIP